MYVVGVDLVKVCKALVRLESGGILCPLFFNKSLLHKTS